MGGASDDGVRRRRLAAGVAFVGLLAAVAWGIERARRGAAEEAADGAAAEVVRAKAKADELRARLNQVRARALAAEAGRAVDAQRALLLARAAVATDPTRAALASLRAALLGCLERAVVRGGEGVVRDVEWSPDGDRIAASWEDGTIVLAAASAAVVSTSRPSEDVADDVAFSPDGARLLCALGDGTARLLDAAAPDLREVTAFRGHAGPVYACRFSPDGTLVATASADGTARLWSPDGTLRAVLRGHEGGVSGALFRPPIPDATAPEAAASDRLLTISRDATARLWSVPDGREIAVLRGHADAVLAAAWTPDGRRIVTGSRDGTARLWDAEGGEVAVLRGPEDAILSVAASWDASRVAIAGKDGTVAVFDAEGGAAHAAFRAHPTAATSIAFTRLGDRLLTSSWDATARLWTLDGREAARFRGHPGWLDRAALSPDGRRLATGARDGTVRLWDTEASEVALLDGFPDEVRALAWSPDGREIACAGPGGMTLVPIDDDRCGRPAAADLGDASGRGAPRAVTWDPATRRWLAGGEFGVVPVRRAGEPSASEPAPEDGRAAPQPSNRDSVVALAALPGGRVAIVHRAGHLEVRAADASLVEVLRVADARIVAVAASADGRLLATGDSEGVLRLWNAAGPRVQELRSAPRRTGALAALAFDPKRGHVLAAADDGQVLALDPADLSVVDGIDVGMSRITAIAVSPSGERVVTAAAGEAPRLWALGAGALLAAAEPRTLRDWTPEERAEYAPMLAPDVLPGEPLARRTPAPGK